MQKEIRFLGMAAVLALAGCGGGSVTEALGFGRNPPDEFAVVDRPSLALPPDFSLKPPMPGAPRPQEVNMRDRAATVTLGAAPKASADRSSGEAALLAAARADKADPAIRETVDREASEKVVASKRLIDSLLWWRDPAPAATTVDAVAERERLKEAAAEGAAVTKGPTPVIEKKKRGWVGL